MKKIILSTILVLALLSTMFMIPASASEPTNLVPADVFQSLEKMQGTFAGAINSDAADFFVDDDGDYVHHVNTPGSRWPYSITTFPDGSFTVKMEIQPIEYENSKTGGTAYGGAGILLGVGEGGAMPWMNVRLDFNYDLDSIEYYIWEHHGSYYGIIHEYGDFWYDGDYTDDLWVEVVMEFTAEETKIYVDGIEVPALDDDGVYDIPAESIGHYPTAEEIKYIGFFSEGSTGGFNVKNFGIYEGVGHDWGYDAPVEDATDAPVADATDAPVADATDTPVVDGGEEDSGNTTLIVIIVVAVVVIAAAVVAVVLLKKKKK